DGELPAAEMEQMRIHLSECSDCAAFAAEMEKTFAVLAAEKSPEVNPYFYTRLKAKLENRASIQYNLKQKSMLVKLLQPAFFSVLLLAGIYTGIKIGQPATENSGLAIYAEQEIIPYLNEMENETIEIFLMEQK
ncbi:MAG TPA: zf-HC2 domain-containing protein, partial [Draconibacterium sp.]|nr:zf-HC2 domain-containing protein [Draconibacterium sp.]